MLGRIFNSLKLGQLEMVLLRIFGMIGGDRWYDPYTPLRDMVNNILIHLTGDKVCDLVDDNGGWNIRVLHSLFSP